MDFLQVFLLQLKEALPICLRISVSMWGIYFSIRFFKDMFIHQSFYFSNPFEDIAEKIQDIRRKKSAKNKSIYYDEDIFNCFLNDLSDDFRCFVIMHRLFDKSSIINFYNDKFGE